eukprot:2158440-Alexandrium_andersonii.AAC.1
MLADAADGPGERITVRLIGQEGGKRAAIAVVAAGSLEVAGEGLAVLQDAAWRKAGSAPSATQPGEQAFEANAAAMDSGGKRSRTLLFAASPADDGGAATGAALHFAPGAQVEPGRWATAASG